ncbi:solute carrier family 35 member E1 homolog [Anopheles ziemanni]|uniref:solute carrier family 35 member E1 homolog n=1 Tax=Anopheles coustani TaxID=139045 RepID=UPI00265A2E90|nr:solute carrier family 35 member E1 homolog [Anopheles coustani]XP_058176166.1 solute carrier family 35 member E1 homolog [Anopheles ziemanni]
MAMLLKRPIGSFVNGLRSARSGRSGNVPLLGNGYNSAGPSSQPGGTGPDGTTRQTLTIVFLCILWYMVSSSNNVIGKMILSEFPYPMTVTMIQLTSITVYSGPFFNLWGVRKYVDISWRYYFKFIVPLALGKFLASVTSHISIWKVPVSYAHTVKATMPLFTVILSRIILRERQTKPVYLSLVPIIVGVGIATLTELSFDVVGLISALIATMGFSLQNIFSKKVLKETGVHHLRLLHILGRLALFMFLPVWIYVDLFNVMKHPAITTGDYRVIALLFTDGVLNWLQNILAFSVLSLVTPLTYAVASASKRIFVIAISLFVLGNPVTWLNVLGMLVAILGVLCYNRAKYFARRSETLLPYAKAGGQAEGNGGISVGTTNVSAATGSGTASRYNQYQYTPLHATISSSGPTDNVLMTNGTAMLLPVIGGVGMTSTMGAPSAGGTPAPSVAGTASGNGKLQFV